MLKLSASLVRRLSPTSCMLRKLSSATVQNVASSDKAEIVANNPNNEKSSNTRNNKNTVYKQNKKLTAAVFASLSNDAIVKIGNSNIKRADENLYNPDMGIEISNAQDLNSLLNLVLKYPIIPRQQALKIVSKLSEWSSTGNVKIKQFEADPRFLKVCRILSKHRAGSITEGVSSGDDLNVIFSVTGDDEATRLITSLTLPQTIKVMTALAQRKRRSTPILRGLAYNLAKYPESIDLKKCSDVLFATSCLNFLDQTLMDRICNDIQENMPHNTDKPSVIGSLALSFGRLGYKDVETLELLTNWILENHSACKPYVAANLVITLANLSHHPTNEEFFVKVSADLHESELSKPSLWLDTVWALTVLERVTVKQVSSVLSSDFIDKLIGENADLSITIKKKLVQIESYIKLTVPAYNGPFLQNDLVENLPMDYNKEKEYFVSSLIDTFKNLIASESFMKTNCNSNMGFLYEIECALDENCNPLPLNTDSAKIGKKVHRVALMALEYHDLCKKTVDPIGAITLHQKLLEKKGFKVVLIPHTEFNPKDKLVDRVQYIERRLKEVILGKPS